MAGIRWCELIRGRCRTPSVAGRSLVSLKRLFSLASARDIAADQISGFALDALDSDRIATVMSVDIRAMRSEEGRRFLEIQRESVRGIAASDYPASVVEAWAPLPITDEIVERFLSNRDHEIRLMAEIDGQPVGIGALVLSNSELRACYVVPSVARRGVGAALVVEIERIARAHGLVYLRLESSLTAEPFYAALGYRVEERGELVLATGVPMAAVKMRKQLE